MHDVPVNELGPTVLVADDNQRFRVELREELERAGLRVVAEARNGLEAVDLALETRPAICLLDINMPGQSGVVAAAIIASALEATSVILITADLTVADVLDAVRAGAAGCISKDMDPRRLPAILDAVAEGESAFPRRELRQALDLLVPARLAI
jgi:DNA-binding NarL/FixJ family response regulator